MRLRSRLAITAVAATLPVVLALFFYDASAQHRAAEERLVDYAFMRMSSQRDACEADPAFWGGAPPPNGMPRMGGPPPPPPRRDKPPGEPPPHNGEPHPPPPDGIRPRARPAILFAYDERFQSKNPDAPAPSAALVRAAAERDAVTTPFLWPTSEVEVLLRMPWRSGPCVYVLARGTTDPSWGAILPESPLWLLPVAAVLAAVLVAVGPVIARIRKLTLAVKRAADASYTSEVAMDGGDEIADLASAFDAAGHEVRAQLAEKERRERALRDFVANTTHDVMVPLAVLQDHLSTLRERASAGMAPEAAVVISAMNEAHYMASLVHNLAVAARLEAAEPSLQKNPVDLCALVERVMGRHRPIARQLDISLERATPAEPLVVSADVTLLEQAVSNVVYNAVRYNRAGGHVAIVLESARENGFSLRVIDDGPGIPKEMLPRLVERGHRGNEARTRAPDGQGLGLHIAFRAAELHGFSMTLGRPLEGGLEVIFEGDGDESIRR